MLAAAGAGGVNQLLTFYLLTFSIKNPFTCACSCRGALAAAGAGDVYQLAVARLEAVALALPAVWFEGEGRRGAGLHCGVGVLCLILLQGLGTRA